MKTPTQIELETLYPKANLTTLFIHACARADELRAQLAVAGPTVATGIDGYQPLGPDIITRPDDILVQNGKPVGHCTSYGYGTAGFTGKVCDVEARTNCRVYRRIPVTQNTLINDSPTPDMAAAAKEDYDDLNATLQVTREEREAAEAMLSKFTAHAQEVQRAYKEALYLLGEWPLWTEGKDKKADALVILHHAISK